MREICETHFCSGRTTIRTERLRSTESAFAFVTRSGPKGVRSVARVVVLAGDSFTFLDTRHGSRQEGNALAELCDPETEPRVGGQGDRPEKRQYGARSGRVSCPPGARKNAGSIRQVGVPFTRSGWQPLLPCGFRGIKLRFAGRQTGVLDNPNLSPMVRSVDANRRRQPK